jgi:hypothetical protein
MSRIMLSLASIWIGIVTIAVAMSILFGGIFSILTFIFMLIFSLILGIALSAPHFARRPTPAVTLWVPWPAIPAVAWTFRIVSGIGLLVLRGVWYLLHRGFTPSTPKPLN